MKATLLLVASALLLTACGGPTDSDPTHAAVTTYLKKNMNDPASYTVARWGRPAVYRQRQADSLAAVGEQRKWQPLAAHAKSAIDSLHQVKLFPDVESLRKASRLGMAAARAADSLQLIIDKLLASKDTARLGTLLTHAYRGKNKLGAVVLDSAQFVVYKDGRVQQL